MLRGVDRRGRHDSDAHRRRLRIVVLGSRDSGKATIVSSILRRNSPYPTCSERGRGEEERVVESRHLAYHELHVHRHRRRRDRDRREDEALSAAAAAVQSCPDETFVRVITCAPPDTDTTVLLLHEELTRDTRYDRVVLNWFKARFRSFEEKRGEAAASTTSATAVVKTKKRRCDGKCCTRALVLYELYYDISDSIDERSFTTDDDDRAMLYAENADVVVIAYDPRDEKSMRCALRLLGAIGRRTAAATRWRDDNRGGVDSSSSSSNDHRLSRSIVLIECDTGSVAAVNPNAIRSLRNYYDAIEVVREQDDIDNAVVILDDVDDNYDDGNNKRHLFARLSCRHGGGDDERNRRALMECVLTRAIAPIVRVGIRSSVMSALPAHTVSWIPAASPTTESTSRDRTKDDDDDDDECRLDNAINELCDD